MRTNLTIAIVIVLLAALLTGAYLVANAEPEAMPAAQDPGSFCLGKYHCFGGDCENGASKPFVLEIPDSEAVCRVDFYFSPTQIIAREGEGCEFGLCVFGWPFGPQLKAFSYPHDPDVERITVHVRARDIDSLPIVMRGYPYP